jgi:hypothetical protein
LTPVTAVPDAPADPEADAEPGGERVRDPKALAENVATIGTAARLLATRITELEAEVQRQAATAEQLRLRLAAEMGANHTGACGHCRAELAALQATRLFRWSERPREMYGRVRNRLGPRR